MRVKHLLCTAVVGVCFTFASTAQAASVTDFFSFDGTEVHGDDDNVETIIKRDQNSALTELAVGDSLRGIFTIDTIRSFDGTVSTVIGEGSQHDVEWTGVFQTKVYDRIFSHTDLDGVDHYHYSFGPDPDFVEAQALGLAASADRDPGAMVLFFQDSTASNNYTQNSGDINTDIANATSGDFFWALGFTEFLQDRGAGALDYTDAAEGWTATSAGDLAQFLGSNDFGDIMGTANFNVNRILGADGVGDNIPLILRPTVRFGGGFVEFQGDVNFAPANPNTVSGDWTQNPTTAWAATSDANFYFNPVPSPAAAGPGLLLLGMLGFMRRRRERDDVAVAA